MEVGPGIPALSIFVFNVSIFRKALSEHNALTAPRLLHSTVGDERFVFHEVQMIELFVPNTYLASPGQIMEHILEIFHEEVGQQKASMPYRIPESYAK